MPAVSPYPEVVEPEDAMVAAGDRVAKRGRGRDALPARLTVRWACRGGVQKEEASFPMLRAYCSVAFNGYAACMFPCLVLPTALLYESCFAQEKSAFASLCSISYGMASIWDSPQIYGVWLDFVFAYQSFEFIIKKNTITIITIAVPNIERASVSASITYHPSTLSIFVHTLYLHLL